MRMVAMILLIAPGLLSAELSHWASKKEPSEIYLTLHAEGDCPITGDELDTLVDDVMSNLGLRRAKTWNELEVNLDVFIACGKYDAGGWSYSYRVMLSKFRIENDQLLLVTFSPDLFEQRFGVGDAATIGSGVRREVESMLKQFRRINQRTEEASRQTE